MARGGHRPGAGRPRKAGAEATKVIKELAREKDDASPETARKHETAIEFAMAVINDPEAAMNDKVRLAIAVLPFQTARADAEAHGKKERKLDNAKALAANSDRFAVPQPPRLVVDNP